MGNLKKIAIGSRLVEGSWGGGNQFASYLTGFIKQQSIEVVSKLDDDDIDLILLTDPRESSSSSTFDALDVLKYVRKKKDTIVVHRINECDERKGTRTVNSQLRIANSVSDHTVFIASWLVDLFKRNDTYLTSSYSIILNGGDENVFKEYGNKLKDDKIKIVTHHWSSSYKKGWNIYLLLDNLLSNKKYKNIEFHYIGKVLPTFRAKNIILHEPLCGELLGMELSKYDVYLTASRNEPAGMHHIEGALCGLPLLYLKSGALPEYCRGFGIEFVGEDDFIFKLDLMLATYKSIRMDDYANVASKMAMEYLSLFVELSKSKKNIMLQRDNSRYGLFAYIRLYIASYTYKLLRVFGYH